MWQGFWTTTDKIGFKLLGAYHLSWLAGIAIAAVVLSIVYANLNQKQRKGLLLVLSGIIILAEIFKQTVLVCTDSFELGYLPFHLCSINMFLCMAYAIKPGELKKELLYALCLPGALLALMFPNWSTLPPVNFFTIHSFAVHGLLVIFPVILLACGEIKPNVKKLPGAFLCVLAICPFMYLFNRRFGTNFMFLNRPGKGNPLVWFEQKLGNPGYLLGMLVIAAALWTVMYAPPTVIKYLKNKK